MIKSYLFQTLFLFCDCFGKLCSDVENEKETKCKSG